MPGGLGCVLPDDAQAWPGAGPVVAKDVWVLAESSAAIEGPRAARTPPLAIRRTAGDMPSRVGDNYFWLGRYLERLEGAARLLRIAIGRLSRPAPTPHEMAELEVLIACLTLAGLLNAEAIEGLGAKRSRSGAAACRRKLGLDPCPARPGLARHRPAA